MDLSNGASCTIITSTDKQKEHRVPTLSPMTSAGRHCDEVIRLINEVLGDADQNEGNDGDQREGRATR